MAKKPTKPETPEAPEAPVETPRPRLSAKITLERNEDGVLVPHVNGVMIEGVSAIRYVANQQEFSLTLGFFPGMVEFTTQDSQKPTVH